jgi:hypothetical protein
MHYCDTMDCDIFIILCDTMNCKIVVKFKCVYIVNLCIVFMMCDVTRKILGIIFKINISSEA